MQRITNKITGEVYEAEQLFDPSMDTQIMIQIKNGVASRFMPIHPENLFLGNVQPNTPITIILNDLNCWTGRFCGIAKSDDGYEIILLHQETDHTMFFNTRNLVGYFLK